MEPYYTTIEVNRSLYEYIVHTTGSRIIRPGKMGILWSVIKQHLICYTDHQLENSQVTEPTKKYSLKIELKRKNGAQTYSHSDHDTRQLNLSCRVYLSNKGKRVITRLLSIEFQKTFLDYMSGATINNPHINIKDIIINFCDQYGMDFANAYEMLKKRWYRHRCRSQNQQNTLINF